MYHPDSDTPFFAVDAVTFFHPAFWGLRDASEVLDLSRRSPDRIWSGILDGMTSAGIGGIELTFPPGGQETALAAFGSPESFRAELSARGVRVVSAFWSPQAWPEPHEPAAVADAAAEYADFVSRCGSDLIVSGLPMRQTFGRLPPRFIDHRFLLAMADIAHAVGDATSRLGVRTAFHTESNSALWYARDVDAFLGLTDPEFVWFCPDTAHLTLSGADPVQVTERHLDRVAIAHWKDASGRMQERPVIDEGVFAFHQRYMRPLGDGVVDWPAWDALMRRGPAADIVLLELDEHPHPVREMRHARAFVERLRRG